MIAGQHAAAMHPFARASRVVLFLRYGIGDVLMEWPVLEALRGAAQHATITLIGASPATQLLDACPWRDEVIDVRAWGVRHLGDAGRPRTWRRIAAWFNRQPPDAQYLDLLQAPVVVREMLWRRGVRGWEADQDAERGAIQRGLGAAAGVAAGRREAWRLPVPKLPRVHLHVPDDVQRDVDGGVDGDLNERPGSGATRIGLCPAASLGLKRWPIARLAALADHLLARDAAARAMLFVGPQRDLARSVLRRLTARHRARVDVVGAEHLLRIAARLRRCRVLIANDTGLAHLAAAVDTPVVAVYGPTSPKVYLPRHPRAQAVGGRCIHCPHREPNSLNMPECWQTDRCLISREGCITQVTVDRVERAVAHVCGG